jgi:hypothetical protein
MYLRFWSVVIIGWIMLKQSIVYMTRSQAGRILGLSRGSGLPPPFISSVEDNKPLSQMVILNWYILQSFKRKGPFFGYTKAIADEENRLNELNQPSQRTLSASSSSSARSQRHQGGAGGNNDLLLHVMLTWVWWGLVILWFFEQLGPAAHKYNETEKIHFNELNEWFRTVLGSECW